MLPEQVEPVVKEIADELKGKLIVSIAAGVECYKLVGFLGGNAQDGVIEYLLSMEFPEHRPTGSCLTSFPQRHCIL